MKQNNVNHEHRLTDSLLTLGWIIMVPGQSIVLYSRLHLISQNFRLMRFIILMILINAIVLCIPTSVLNLRQYTKHPEHYTHGYVIMEKIQMTIFTAQEIFISCVYFWEIRRVLKVIFDGKTRKSMWKLAAMNAVLLILDATLLTVEYLNLYMIETTFKSLVYSFKLKIEFGVLSQIVNVIQNRSEPNSLSLAVPKVGTTTEVMEISSSDCEAQIMQQNLPPEWRMSAPLTLNPNVLGIQRDRNPESPTQCLTPVEKLYPGRLG